jgi:copper chaperone CopZ
MKNLVLVILAGFLATAAIAQQTETAPAAAPAKACAGMKDGKACADMKATGSTDKGTDGMVKKTAVASVAGLETATFKVNGVCGMCKRTIEKGAKAGGAASADWDADTHVMVITFDAKTTNVDAIHKAIAATGYDTEKVKADDGTYKKLHGCCQYDRTTL